MNRNRPYAKYIFPLCWALIVFTSLNGSVVLAQEICAIRANDEALLFLPEGQKKKSCASWIQLSPEYDKRSGTGGFELSTVFRADGRGPYEVEIILELTEVQARIDKDSEFEVIDLDAVTYKENLSVRLGLDELDLTEGQWWVKSTPPVWQFNVQLPVEIEDYKLIVKMTDPSMSRKSDLAKFRFDITLGIRRITEGCWVDGNVKGTRVWGDYAFWSDNPTGIQPEEAEQSTMSEDTAQAALAALSNLDPTMLAKLGIDPGQVASAQAEGAKQLDMLEGAKEVQKLDDVANPVKPTLADEFAQFDGHTFLTLQSVRGDDNVQLIGGPSAGIAGDLSEIDLARGIGHILSKFSMTLELAAELDPESESYEFFLTQPLPVARAGLVFEGLKYTWPRDGGEPPALELSECESAAPSNDAMCGQVRWPNLGTVHFQAGPGAFSCINN